MAKRNNKEMFNIPEMSNYDANEDAKQYEKTKEVGPIGKIKLLTKKKNV